MWDDMCNMKLVVLGTIQRLYNANCRCEFLQREKVGQQMVLVFFISNDRYLQSTRLQPMQ